MVTEGGPPPVKPGLSLSCQTASRHQSTFVALWALPDTFRLLRVGFLDDLDNYVEQLATASQAFLALSVRKQAVVSDAHEASGQDVLRQSTQDLDTFDTADFPAIAIPVILPTVRTISPSSSKRRAFEIATLCV